MLMLYDLYNTCCWLLKYVQCKQGSCDTGAYRINCLLAMKEQKKSHMKEVPVRKVSIDYKVYASKETQIENDPISFE